MKPKRMLTNRAQTLGRLLGRGLVCALLALSTPLAAVQAEEFTLHDLQGKVLHLKDYRGKWVLVNFWATWCPPCLSEIPELVSLHQAHKNKDLVVIGIAVDSGSTQAVAEFVKTHGINYPMVMEDDGTRQQVGETDVLPTSYLYDPAGKLVSYQQGKVTRESVETYIKNNK